MLEIRRIRPTRLINIPTKTLFFNIKTPMTISPKVTVKNSKIMHTINGYLIIFGTFLFSDRDAGDRKLICGRATRSKEWKPVWDHSFFCAVNIPEMPGWALPA